MVWRSLSSRVSFNVVLVSNNPRESTSRTCLNISVRMMYLSLCVRKNPLSSAPEHDIIKVPYDEWLNLLCLQTENSTTWNFFFDVRTLRHYPRDHNSFLIPPSGKYAEWGIRDSPDLYGWYDVFQPSIDYPIVETLQLFPHLVRVCKVMQTQSWSIFMHLVTH